MQVYEQKLIDFMKKQGIKGQHMHFEQSCHSVKEAAAAAKARETDFVKNICMITDTGKLIVAILKGEDKVNSQLVGEAMNFPPLRFATPSEILEKTRYPVGGTPSFGYSATFLIDPRVMEKKIVYSGGGSAQSLVKISLQELVRANKGDIVPVRK